MNTSLFDQKYQKYKQVVEVTIEEYLRDEMKKMDTYNSPFIAELYNLINQYIIEGGKRLRPILSMIFYEALSGKKLSKEINKSCLLFEFFHNYTLIHDDIYDEDILRRSKEAIHFSLQKWIKKQSEISFANEMCIIYRNSVERFGAVGGFIAGKLTSNLTQKLLNSLKIEESKKMIGYQLLAEVYDIDNIGQALDLYFEYGSENIGEKEYAKMTQLKTCHLIIKSAVWGAHLAGVNKSLLPHITEFALFFGEAFQIHDDLIDLDPVGFKGHSFASDLKQGKKTLIVLHFLQHARGNNRKKFERYFGHTNITDNDLGELVLLLEKEGSIQYTKEIMKQKVQSALKCLDILKPHITQSAYIFLQSFVTKITDVNV